MKKAAIAILLILSVFTALPEEQLKPMLETPPTKTLDIRTRKNIGIVLGAEAGLYTVSMTGLYFAWYSNYPQTRFHFFNDNAEWLQMDKMGHAATAYNVGALGYEALRAAGLDETRSIWFGGSLGFLFLSTVEVFDGLSSQWGFSWGDMAANTVGAGLFIGQQLLWHEQKMSLKYSFHPTKYPEYRPDVLGANLLENMIKDYNGITVWLSINCKSLFFNDKTHFPSWLNIAVGYSADGMTGGFNNATSYHGTPIPEFQRTRQFFLSLDIDFTKIKTNNKLLQYTFKVLNIIKIPFPAVEYSSNGQWAWHWLYF
ncbi:MAG: DUF2279 domain-containing protein [Candidatus Limimorpha sp.]